MTETRGAACRPCTTRKVRCDRNEPCSNCKRRQQHCTYPETSPAERIKHLEALVRELRQNPENTRPTAGAQTEGRESSSNTRDLRSNDPVLVEEDGKSTYLESYSWPYWDRNSGRSSLRRDSHEKGLPRASGQTQMSSSALQNIIFCNNAIDLSRMHPSLQESTALWNAFRRNVNPLLKISFDWELDRMRAAAALPPAEQRFTAQEHACLFALYLVTVMSLSEDECLAQLGQSRALLLSEYQMLCEQALAKSDFLGSSEVMLIQAADMYITASIDRLNTRSLWSLMGIVIRHAEKLGLHRDGTILNLSPAETEKRRRIWWHLQHLDMALAVRSGSVSLTMLADWDAKLPLNIEDDDIDFSMSEFPPERTKITSMSYNLWTYWVLYEQRSFRRPDGSRLGSFWMAEKSLSHDEKEVLLNRLESGLNNRFLQYCDPIRPLDSFVQINARSFICGMRRLTLQSLQSRRDVDSLPETYESDLFDLCARSLEYDIALHSHPSLKNFRWLMKGYFPWSAFVYVIVAASRQQSTTHDIWALLTKVYTANTTLLDFSEDRRKPRAAELMVAAWKSYEVFLLESHQQPRTPALIADLEALLPATGNADVVDVDLAERKQSPGRGIGMTSNQRYANKRSAAVMDRDTESTAQVREAEKTSANYFDMNTTIFDPELIDIDWEFWGALD